jgi:hypothetical protein
MVGSAPSSRAPSQTELPEAAPESAPDNPAGAPAGPVTPRPAPEPALRLGSGSVGEQAVKEGEPAAAAAAAAAEREAGGAGLEEAPGAALARLLLLRKEQGRARGGHGQPGPQRGREKDEAGAPAHSPGGLPSQNHDGGGEQGPGGALQLPVEGAVQQDGEPAGGPGLLLPHQAAGVEGRPALWMDLVLLGSVSAGAYAMDVVAP